MSDNTEKQKLMQAEAHMLLINGFTKLVAVRDTGQRGYSELANYQSIIDEVVKKQGLIAEKYNPLTYRDAHE